MEIAISRDIRKYKTKDVGNFSFKEAGVIVLACASAFMVFKMSGKGISYSFNAYSYGTYTYYWSV